MARKIFIVDTNVVISGQIGSDSSSPPARILGAMLEGAFPYVVSTALFNEYSSVLRRPAVVRQHGLTDPEVVLLLSNLTENAIWHDPVISNMAPDLGDNHIWALLESLPHAQLITGDKLLIENPSVDAIVISPRNAMEMILVLPFSAEGGHAKGEHEQVFQIITPHFISYLPAHKVDIGAATIPLPSG